jgi:uncharacterized repeat protein (TIGR01451 family)
VRTITSTFSVPVGYSGADPIQNTAAVTSTTTDPTPANNSSTASTALAAGSADVSISLQGPAAVKRGGDAVYTITVTNNGPSGAVGVQVADPTPAGLTFVSNSGDCTSAFPCALGGVASGASRTITATFSVPAGYAGAEPIVNTATVQATTPDPASSNNSATASSLVDVLMFNTLAPCRVLDTRDPDGPLGGPILSPGQQRAFVVTGGSCGIPSTAKAVSVNLTVVGPTGPGFVTVFPGDGSLPATSSINFSAGQVRANNGVFSLAGDGSGTLNIINGSSGSTHVILDVNGYFEP